MRFVLLSLTSKCKLSGRNNLQQKEKFCPKYQKQIKPFDQFMVYCRFYQTYSISATSKLCICTATIKLMLFNSSVIFTVTNDQIHQSFYINEDFNKIFEEVESSCFIYKVSLFIDSRTRQHRIQQRHCLSTQNKG